jgi:hypothetical protein
MNVDSFAVTLAAFAVNGVGIGLTLPAINMTILELSPVKTASALSILNFFWGVGAIICKPFVDLFEPRQRHPDHDDRPGGSLLIAAALLFLQPTRLIGPERTPASERDSRTFPSGPYRWRGRSRCSILSTLGSKAAWAGG